MYKWGFELRARLVARRTPGTICRRRRRSRTRRGRALGRRPRPSAAPERGRTRRKTLLSAWRRRKPPPAAPLPKHRPRWVHPWINPCSLRKAMWISFSQVAHCVRAMHTIEQVNCTKIGYYALLKLEAASEHCIRKDAVVSRGAEDWWCDDRWKAGRRIWMKLCSCRRPCCSKSSPTSGTSYWKDTPSWEPLQLSLQVEKSLTHQP